MTDKREKNKDAKRELNENEMNAIVTRLIADIVFCIKELFGLKEGVKTVVQRNAKMPAAITVDKPVSRSDEAKMIGDFAKAQT
jgi:hypothetical protein